MKKAIIPVLLFAITAICCTSLGKKTPNLFIKTITAIGDKKTDSTSVVTSDYFEVGLRSFPDESKGLMAEKEVERPTSIENFRMIYFVVVNEDGSDIYFKSSTEFLNYMSERGYEMVTQTKSKRIERDVDYTFKKK